MSDATVPSTDPDQALLERARTGERQAFEELIRKYQREIYALLYRYVWDPEVAADLVQNTFVRVISQFHQFRGTGRFRTWLYRIASNLAKNYLRNRSRWRTTALESFHLTSDPVGTKQISLEEEILQLRCALETLPPKQRLTVELRIYQELPFKEIAEIMECNVGTAKVNFHYALKNLRQRMVPEPTRSQQRKSPKDDPSK